MHTQISLSLPLLSKMLTPPQQPNSRRTSGAGSTAGSYTGSGTAAGAAGGQGSPRGAAGVALVDGLWELQQLVAAAALELFGEYEELVSRDGNKMLPADGTIHPLTAQVLSYVKVGICLFVFLEGQRVMGVDPHHLCDFCIMHRLRQLLLHSHLSHIIQV